MKPAVAAHEACVKLNPYIERIVADSVNGLRRKGKLQAVVDSFYMVYTLGGKISMAYNTAALPDSVRSLAAAAGPSCTLLSTSFLLGLVGPELKHVIQSGPAKVDSVAGPTK